MPDRFVFAYPPGSPGTHGSENPLSLRRAAKHDHAWWLIPAESIGAPEQIVAIGQVRIEKHHVDAVPGQDTASRRDRLGHRRDADIGFHLQPCRNYLREGALLIYDKNVELHHVIQPG
jgi:hypothetical protein